MVKSKSSDDSFASKYEADEERDITEEELKQIYARAATQKFDENPRYPYSDTAGAVPMLINGRFANERERLGPDFNEWERMWRVKWIEDQKLHPLEPFEVKQLYKEYYNPIRRFYRAPLELFERSLAKYTGKEFAWGIRQFIGRGVIIYFGVLMAWYHIKYNNAHWEKQRGPRLWASRPRVYPGDPRFPYAKPKTEPHHFYDRGFSKRKVFLDVENY